MGDDATSVQGWICHAPSEIHHLLHLQHVHSRPTLHPLLTLNHHCTHTETTLPQHGRKGRFPLFATTGRLELGGRINAALHCSHSRGIAMAAPLAIDSTVRLLSGYEMPRLGFGVG